jgi:organic hydroperoxide reductase OsmC/OhrA
MAVHRYTTEIKWTGNKGTGTSAYNAYERSHTLTIAGKPELLCSSDVVFNGDGSRHNPEDLFVAALSSCHMLWYLHLCADAGVIVTAYSDRATGVLSLDAKSPGRFTGVTLHPVVIVAEESMIEKANALHDDAHRKCFISNSCNFPVTHAPVCVAKKGHT